MVFIPVFVLGMCTWGGEEEGDEGSFSKTCVDVYHLIVCYIMDLRYL